MKNIFKSKVFWIAVVQGVIGVWAVLETSMPAVGWIVIVKSLLDVTLRFITTMPVGFSER
jgi:hypothetical protein